MHVCMRRTTLKTHTQTQSNPNPCDINTTQQQSPDRQIRHMQTHAHITNQLHHNNTSQPLRWCKHKCTTHNNTHITINNNTRILNVCWSVTIGHVRWTTSAAGTIPHSHINLSDPAYTYTVRLPNIRLMDTIYVYLSLYIYVGMYIYICIYIYISIHNKPHQVTYKLCVVKHTLCVCVMCHALQHATLIVPWGIQMERGMGRHRSGENKSMR